jgi:hypothetical protein
MKVTVIETKLSASSEITRKIQAHKTDSSCCQWYKRSTANTVSNIIRLSFDSVRGYVFTFATGFLTNFYCTQRLENVYTADNAIY